MGMERRNTFFIAALTILTACPSGAASTVEPTSIAGSTGSSSEESGLGESEAASGSTGADAPALAGRWLSPCFDQGDGTFAMLDFDLSDEAWSLDYRVHGDETCSSPLVTVRIEGPYTIEGRSDVDEAWDAVFGFDAKTITPHAQPLVDALDGAGCGREPWAVDVTQSIDDGCAAFGQYPLDSCAADYDLVSRDGDTLRFGNRPPDNDMCTAERRPHELSPLAMARQ